jgi:NarL family two-component system response regulator LiaR
MIRMSLFIFMSACDGIEVVGEGKNGEDAIVLAKNLEPGVILMDIVMPKLEDAQATAYIYHHFLHICVLMLTPGTDYRQIEVAQAAGAVGYLLKTVHGTEIVDTIQNCVNGGYTDYAFCHHAIVARSLPCSTRLVKKSL